MSGDKRVLSIADIEQANDTEYAEVEALGGVIRLGSLDAEAIMAFNEANEDPVKKKISGVHLVVRSLVDHDGNRIGTDKDVAMLMKKSTKTIKALVDAALKLNGADEKVIDAKNDSGEAAGSAASPTV